MTTTCPCGQTYGTCRRHTGLPPEICSLLFLLDGAEMVTWIVRSKRMADREWRAAQRYAAEQVSKNLTPPDKVKPLKV